MKAYAEHIGSQPYGCNRNCGYATCLGYFIDMVDGKSNYFCSSLARICRLNAPRNGCDDCPIRFECLTDENNNIAEK